VILVWRTALKPSWLGLLALVVLAATLMAGLGQWQFRRARAEGVDAQRHALQRAPVPMTRLFGPQEQFPAAGIDRPVTVTGTWVWGEQVVVAGQKADESAVDGPTGYWLLMPLRLPSGAAIAVVRGWSAEPGHLEAPSDPVQATGQVTVRAVLRISDPPVERGPGESAGLPAGQLEGVDLTQLIHLWPEPLYTGYLIATDLPVPPGFSAVSALHAGSGLAWRNISYALQWWLFAGFGLFIWFRLVRDDHLGRRRPRPTSTPSLTQRPNQGVSA